MHWILIFILYAPETEPTRYEFRFDTREACIQAGDDWHVWWEGTRLFEYDVGYVMHCRPVEPGSE